MNAEVSVIPSGSESPALAQASQAAAARPAVQAPQPVELKVNPEQDRQELRAALDQLNDQMRSSQRGLRFSMDERLGRTVIIVENENTGKVVRQIPDEAALKVARNIEALKGVLLDENL